MQMFLKWLTASSMAVVCALVAGSWVFSFLEDSGAPSTDDVFAKSMVFIAMGIAGFQGWKAGVRAYRSLEC